MRHRISLLPVIVLAACGSKPRAEVALPASEPETLHLPCFERTYPGPGGDSFGGMAALADGGFVITGSITDQDGAQQLRLVRVDAEGKESWDQILGASDNDWGTVVVPLPDGFAVLGGTWSEAGGGLADAWLVRTDAGGEVIWQKTFGGEGSDRGEALLALPDGGFAIAVAALSSLGDRALLVRTDAEGNELWSQPVGVGEPVGLHASSDGGFVVAGWGELHAWLARTDDRGNVVAQVTFPNPPEDERLQADASAELRDGRLALIGWRSVNDLPATRLIVTDAALGIVRDQDLSTDVAATFEAMAMLPDGALALAGGNSQSQDDWTKAWVMVLEPDGAVRWQRTYESGTHQFASAILAVPDGLVIGGEVEDASGYHLWLRRTDLAGGPCQ